MHQSSRVIWFSLLGLCLLSVVSAYAQTPLDTIFTSIQKSSIIWGVTLITIGGIVLALLLAGTIHLGPQMLMGVVLGFVALFIIGLAANGQLAAWMMGTVTAQ